jgi:hypothetical protein
VQCLAIVGELLGVVATLLLESLGDQGLKPIKLGLAIIQELLGSW